MENDCIEPNVAELPPFLSNLDSWLTNLTVYKKETISIENKRSLMAWWGGK